MWICSPLDAFSALGILVLVAHVSSAIEGEAERFGVVVTSQYALSDSALRVHRSYLRRVWLHSVAVSIALVLLDQWNILVCMFAVLWQGVQAGLGWSNGHMETLEHELNESTDHIDIETSETNAATTPWLLRLGPYALFLISGVFVLTSFSNSHMEGDLTQMIVVYVIGIVICIITEILARNQEKSRKNFFLISQYFLSTTVSLLAFEKLDIILGFGEFDLLCMFFLIALSCSAFMFLKFGVVGYDWDLSSYPTDPPVEDYSLTDDGSSTKKNG